MIYEFIVYPHEVLYTPIISKNETLYQVKPFIDSVVDSFDFPKDFALAGGSKDEFDLSVVENVTNATYCKTRLETICNSIIDSLGYGQYAFILHNKDEKAKPHFHVIFLFERGEEFNINDTYYSLGMISFKERPFFMRKKEYTEFIVSYPPSTAPRLYIYEDFMRSSRLRYLCHLDNLDKFQYSLTEVHSSFNYIDDTDVIAPKALTPFAMFLNYRTKYKLNDEVDWLTWLANARISSDTRKELSTIKTDIHRYFVSWYYRSQKKF